MRSAGRCAWLWTLSGATLVGCVLLLWAFWIEPTSFALEEAHLRVDGPIPPVRIAILTDLHVGSPFNGIEKLRRLVDDVNRAKPDVICVLGDLVIQGVIGGRFVDPEAIATELSRLQSAAPTIAVLGNHDGWLDRQRVAQALEQRGTRVIEDTATRLRTPKGPIWFAGVSDLWTGPHDLDAALDAVDEDDAPIILLTHNPDVFPKVPKRVTLTLAGHTHGGQVRLPFVGRPIVPSRYGQRYAAGHVIEGGRHLFVATGVGTSILPVRFRVPPSVVMLSVESALHTKP